MTFLIICLDHIEQAGSAYNAVTAIKTAHIENGFEQKLTTVVAFINLLAAYETVWSLLYKALETIPRQTLYNFLKHN